MRSRHWTALLLLFSFSLAPLAADAAPAHVSHFTLFSWSWLRAPFAWLAHSEPEEMVCDSPTCRELLNPAGFRTMVFDAPDHGLGLYVQISGSVQFRSAEIVFAGGEVDRLDLQYAIRSDGVFELRDFGRDRDVLEVHLVARASSPRSLIAVRFGRPLE
jgi:hypothetical protein